jgi:hypothetical protein
MSRSVIAFEHLQNFQKHTLQRRRRARVGTESAVPLFHGPEQRRECEYAIGPLNLRHFDFMADSSMDGSASAKNLSPAFAFLADPAWRFHGVHAPMNESDIFSGSESRPRS